MFSAYFNIKRKGKNKVSEIKKITADPACSYFFTSIGDVVHRIEKPRSHQFELILFISLLL